MLRKRETKSFKSCRCCYKWRCRCLPRRRKPPPPFNSGTGADSKLGLHPKLRALAPPSPAVGTYDPRPIDRKSRAISWRREKEAEEFSATMGCKLSKEISFQRNLMRTGRGPGTHEIPRWPESAFDGLCRSLRQDADFGTVPRFQPCYKSTTPGPGYTLRVHNPYYYLDQKRLSGFSQVPSFEFDGLAPRFRDVRKSWSLACNRYKIKHPDSLQTFLEKVTGKRGPYDLFTGPRDESTIGGYWVPVKLEDLRDWPRDLPGEMEKLLSKSNYFKGKWSTDPRYLSESKFKLAIKKIISKGLLYFGIKLIRNEEFTSELFSCYAKAVKLNHYNGIIAKISIGEKYFPKRFTKKPTMRIMLQDISMCYKNPDEPGPGHYEPQTPRKPSTLKRYPFDSNVEFARPLPPSDIRPGPGRYRVKQAFSIKGHGWTCVFKSKVPRTIGAIMPPAYGDL